MAKTLKAWDKEVKQAYLDFAGNPNCSDCPLGFSDRPRSYEYFRLYQAMINRKYKTEACACCHHILGTQLSQIHEGAPCPCHVYSEEEALEILQIWKEKQDV